MTNTVKTINDYLIDNFSDKLGVDIIYRDLFYTAEGLEIMSRHDPSQARVIEYLDGSSVGEKSISYYVRDENPETCDKTLQTIAGALDNLEITDISDSTTSYTLSVDSVPSFNSIDDKNQFIYKIDVTISFKHGD